MAHPSTRRLPRVGTACILLTLLLAALPPLAAPPLARAQACLADPEPNETPETATPIAGETCLEGTILGDDQDLFAWTVTDVDAVRRWTIELTGSAASQTRLAILRFDSSPDQVPPTLSGELAALVVEPGAPPARDDLVFAPGRYLLGLARSSALEGVENTGAYRVTLTPTDPPAREAEPNDDAPTALPTEGAFAVGGDLQGSEDWVAWSPGDDPRSWRLALQGPLGTRPSLSLQDAAGTPVLDRYADPDGRLVLEDLALGPGPYLIRLYPLADTPFPYVLEATPGEERPPDGEREPNDGLDTALPFDPARPFRGRLAGTGDVDHLRLVVEPSLAATLFDVRLKWRSPVERALCLLDAAGTELLCRRGTDGIALTNLLLPAGEYVLRVSGELAPADPYLLRIDTTTLPDAAFEAEPNEAVGLASPMSAEREIRGFLTGDDLDLFRLTVTGTPQLWQVEASGPGLADLNLVTAANNYEVRAPASADTPPRALLQDIYLLPGDHWFAVRGNGGDYTLRATPLGPPDPRAEREPNDDPSRSGVLPLGEERTGRLASAADVDVFRFSLAAEEHLAFRVAPPADAGIRFWLEWSGTRLVDRREGAPGAPFVYDAMLPPGDYVLFLSSGTPGDGSYRLLVERRDPLTPPLDREPNDEPHQAGPLSPALTAGGTVVSSGDRDWYLIPPRPEPGAATITLSGDVTLALFDGETALPLAPNLLGTAFDADLPADRPLLLRVDGDGAYRLKVAFDDLGSLLAPRAPGVLAVDLALTAPVDAVAAFRSESQRLDAALTLTNAGDDPLALTLDAVTSDLRCRVALDRTTVALDPGGTTTLPVRLRVDPDLPTGPPLRVTVRARDAAGSQATAFVELAVDSDVPPVNPSRAWPLSDLVLGGLNAAAPALGAVPLGASDGRGADAVAAVFDGITEPGFGFMAAAGALPLTITVDLAGDDPIPVGGVILTPEGVSPGFNTRAADMPRAFEVLLSVDGVTFEPALSGALIALPTPQPFAFDTPIPARFAQLVIYSTHGRPTDNVALAEWEVIAQPGAAPSPAGLNLADPALGGHILRPDPTFSTATELAQLLLPDDTLQQMTIEAGARPEWVVAFADNRAAQIASLEWVDPPGSNPDARFSRLALSVSLESPSGPWEPLATWRLDRAAAPDGRTMTLALDAPVWARYVRFVADGPADRAFWEYPDVVRIIERPTGDDYRSIIGAWGRHNPAAIYEFLNPTPEPPPRDPDAGGDPAAARALPLGETARDSAQIGVDEDWYRVEIPAGQNALRLAATGDPTVDVDVEVRDDRGNPIPVAPDSATATRTVFTAAVEPGRAYLVRVTQPVHSVVFAFDTSTSLANYLDPIYRSLVGFAGGVTPGRELANFLPFGGELLLDDWIDDPYALQAALVNDPRTLSDSDSPAALVKATEALAGRPGTTAIMLITDAETSFTALVEAWAGLDAVRPRIFAVQLGGARDLLALDRALLQDWAGVNRGHYVYATTQADLDVAFARVAAWLRRPATYTLTAAAAFEEAAVIPEPTSAPTATPTPTPTPAAPPEPTPEAVEPGTLQVVAPRRAAGRPAAAAVAEGVAVELILDTSGSMLQPLAGTTRLEVARAALLDLVTDTLPAGTPLALRVFGATPDSCETILAAPLAPLDPAGMAATINALQAVNLVRTPLGASLALVAEDLRDAPGPKIVVLVTDGEETCGGDPEAAIRALVESGVDVHVNIVGFALDDEELKRTFRRWARIGQGRYIDAGSVDELREAVAEAVQAPFRVLDAAGTVVASGVVGGTVRLPPGVYTVEVLTDPVQRIENVEVGSGERTRLTLVEPPP